MHVAEVPAESVMRAQKLRVTGHLEHTPCGVEGDGTLSNNAKLSMLFPLTTAAHLARGEAQVC